MEINPRGKISLRKTFNEQDDLKRYIHSYILSDIAICEGFVKKDVTAGEVKLNNKRHFSFSALSPTS